MPKVNFCQQNCQRNELYYHFFFLQYIPNKKLIKFFPSPVWLCAQCSVYYDNEEIEVRLLDSLHRKVMSYTLQDLRCQRCRQIKRENIATLCSCAGEFETLINVKDLHTLLHTFVTVADDHRMWLLKEQCELLQKTF